MADNSPPMAEIRNILFIMCDQLRADYLGCTGHGAIRTPHIDALAARGVTFSASYAQAPVCGPSRMSFYTGRYVSSHGSTYNNIPLPISIPTLGDHLRPLGFRVVVVGKTHVAPDLAGLKRLGLSAGRTSPLTQGGFEPVMRDDGLHPNASASRDAPYNRFLRSQGYDGDNPWHDYAHSALDANGLVRSGWLMRHARLPARVADEHSESAFVTDTAIRFIEEAGSQPWCLHVSYIKPHWPYMVSAPYHALYDEGHVPAANRDERERTGAHPVHARFMELDYSQSFQRDDVRATVIPTYMGLVTQVDAHIGRLIDRLRDRRLLDETLIVVTSDHGDYLGDHWLGEKDLFHEESVRIPLVIVDPTEAADETRGRRSDALVEAVDLLPTFIDVAGGQIPGHVVEGHSLLPLIRAPGCDWPKEAAFSECDYSHSPARLALGLRPHEARGFMIRTRDWKYAFFEKLGPQLLDLRNDPRERCDLGADPGYEKVRRDLNEQLFAWMRALRHRRTVSDDEIERHTGTDKQKGFLIGVW